uniref:Uncharacterized protein n=2 Tax=Babesia bovis TaxID=5865 RepID=A7AM06_BABBO|eukprot:XP_001611158.1 hypothetical protein [Babesia bovis T2Bo]
MDNGIKKAKHFSCKRYGEKRSFFLASLFMRALAESHEVPSEDFINYWAAITDGFGAFKDPSSDSPDTVQTSSLDSSLLDQAKIKDVRFSCHLSSRQNINNLADTLAEYKLVHHVDGDYTTSTPCLIREDSSVDLNSDTSRDDSDQNSEASVSSKEESAIDQLYDNPRVRSSIFFDGDYGSFMEKQKLLFRVIEDLNTSFFVSKPSVDFVPTVDLESIERDYIVIDQKILGSRDADNSESHNTRPRSLGVNNIPSKRVCSSLMDRKMPRPRDYNLDRVLKRCAECGPDIILTKNKHLQKLVSILSGSNPVEVYSNEVIDGIYTVNRLCAKTQSDFGPRSFYSPSLRHPIDSFVENDSDTINGVDKSVYLDNTLYSYKNAFMMPRNVAGYLTKQKEDLFNSADGDEATMAKMPRMSNSKLANFVESLCGVDFDQKIIENSINQNAKECCDLRSLIQLCQREPDVGDEKDLGRNNESTRVPNEYFTSTANHVGQIEGFDTTHVTYYKNRVVPINAVDNYTSNTAYEYNKGDVVRMEGAGLLDLSTDTFTAFDGRRQNMNHYLEAIDALEKRIRDIQERSEKMQRALHLYSQQPRTEDVNDLQEMLSLETLLFVCDTLMETKRRLHEELRRKVQDELDMINHILPEPLADSLTRILYPNMAS